MGTYTQPLTTKRQYRSLEKKQRIVEEALTEGLPRRRSCSGVRRRSSI